MTTEPNGGTSAAARFLKASAGTAALLGAAQRQFPSAAPSRRPPDPR